MPFLNTPPPYNTHTRLCFFFYMNFLLLPFYYNFINSFLIETNIPVACNSLHTFNCNGMSLILFVLSLIHSNTNTSSLNKEQKVARSSTRDEFFYQTEALPWKIIAVKIPLDAHLQKKMEKFMEKYWNIKYCLIERDISHCHQF